MDRKTQRTSQVTPDVLYGRYTSASSVVDDLETYLILANEDPSYIIEDVRYDEITLALITGLSIIPVERAIAGEESFEDVAAVSEAFERMVKLLAVHFNKPYTVVKDQVYNAMATFPIDDVRQAYELKVTNKLH